MASNFLIAVIFTIGASAWIYAKTNRQTGGNTQTALIVAGISGFLLFLTIMLVLSLAF